MADGREAPGSFADRVVRGASHDDPADSLRVTFRRHDPAVIRTILAHLALCHSGQSPGPAPPASGAAAS